MAMTEKQGGTDVRANTTRAYPVGAPAAQGQAYELVGHKWFCSAPMCDGFLTLAQTDKGLSCFLLPRHRPDDTRNAFYIQRLKNKLGNSSNASSEVEFRGALAWMVGEEGRGVPTIIEMVAMTRFDCMVGSSALMRQALTQASHHCAHRTVGGRVLSEQPLMQNVLADLALESEAALALSLRMGQALDHPARPAAGEVRAAGDGGGQVLDLQTGAGDDQRSRRVHGRRRVCRGQHPAAPVPRGPGQLNVGRLRQRAVPGRAARLVQRAGCAGRRCSSNWGMDMATGDWRSTSRSSKSALMDTEDIQYRARQLTEDIAVGVAGDITAGGG
jgi:putative acyl-CoA dehydrogenase